MNEQSPKNDDILPVSAVYDKIAKSFDTKRKYPWREVSDFIETLNSNMKVLDLGCGNGRHMRLLLENQIESFGVDISFRILEIALQNELSTMPKTLYHLTNADTNLLSFKENSFDCVLMIAVLHHLDSNKSRIGTLKEIYRTLKKEGQIFISCWLRTHPRFSKDDLKDIIAAGEKNILVPWKLSSGKQLLRYYYLFDPEELINLLSSCQFTIKSKFISNHNIFILAQKKVFD